MSDKKGMEIDNMEKNEEFAEGEVFTESEELAEDQAFISDMFEQDDLEVPDSLSRDSVASMLKAADEKKAVDAAQAAKTAGETQRKKVSVKKHFSVKPLGWIAAVAACFMLIALPVLNSGQARAEDLTTFKSYDEIYKMIDEINAPVGGGILYGGGNVDIVEEDAADTTAPEGSAGRSLSKNYAANNMSGTSQGAGEQGHSDTYVQVEGVDEADLVKVDGKYLYFISSSRDKILIYSTDDGKADKVSTIECNADEYLKQIFLAGDRLTVICDVYSDEGESETAAKIYDVADRRHPKKTAEYVQSGISVSQRMVGDILYLVTDQYAYGRAIPYCRGTDKMEKLKANDICCVPSPVSAEYTIIGAVNTASGKELSHVTKAVLGGSQDIYSNGENLYIAGTTYPDRKKADQVAYNGGIVRRIFHPYYYGRPSTMIIKIKLSGGKIKITDTHVVKGTIDDQFSMDERDGEFRIATTSMTDEGTEINNLFVLDKHLEELGHVTGFARNESIKAVRYIKDKAYVITYEQTDPLFVIDLSNSKDPKIEGSVKIDGFSTLLVPLSDDRLLGIGYGTKQVESWQETSGLKFALFDISDPSEPKVVTSKTLDGVFSDVQEDHRALVMIGEGENTRFVIPCWNEYEAYAVDEDEDEGYEVYEDEGPRGGILELTVPGDVIDILQYMKTDEAVDRCPVIGDYIYAVCDDDTVVPQKLAE